MRQHHARVAMTGLTLLITCQPVCIHRDGYQFRHVYDRQNAPWLDSGHDGYQEGPSKWTIFKDLDRPTQPYVLAHQASNDPGNRAPLDQYLRRDAFAGRRRKRAPQTHCRPGRSGWGVVWRYLDENNYYLVWANAIDKSVTVYKVEKGQRRQLMAAAKHEVSLNGWSILKVSMRGNRFQVYVDHRRILQGEDGTFSHAGKVGLWTGGDSVTYFDDFRVYPR